MNDINLDSSFRWNDDEGGNGFVASPLASFFTLAGMPDKNTLPSFRRRPESSGLYNPFPRSENDSAFITSRDDINEQHDPA